MKETEYIKVTNLAKYRVAISALRDVSPGFDGVTDETQLKEIVNTLYGWVMKLENNFKVVADT